MMCLESDFPKPEQFLPLCSTYVAVALSKPKNNIEVKQLIESL